jgi:hypothetical protein
MLTCASKAGSLSSIFMEACEAYATPSQTAARLVSHVG